MIARGVGNSIYNTDDFILSALRTASVLLRKFISLYRDTPAAAALFSHAKSAVDRVNTEDYPKSLQVSRLICVYFLLMISKDVFKKHWNVELSFRVGVSSVVYL